MTVSVMKSLQPPSILTEAQAWLSGLILAGTSALGDRIGEAAEHLAGASGDDADARLRAYVGGYPARIREALAEAYPAVCNLVGAHEFAHLAARYAPCAPVGEYSLDAAAADFASFVHRDVLSDGLPFLCDLAAVEWRVLRAFHAVDLPAADLGGTAQWDLARWAGAVLEFQPSLSIVESQWPVHDLWAARDTPREEIDIAVENRPQAVMAYRDGPYDSIDVVVRCEIVSAGCAMALTQLVAGASLGEVMSALADAGEDPEPVTQWFSAWASAGLVSGIA